MKKLIILVISFLLLVLVISQWALPRIAEQQISNFAKQSLGAERTTVAVRATPSLILLAGHADSIVAQVSGATSEKFAAEQINVALNNVKLDAGALYAERRLVIKSAETIDASLIMNEANLTKTVEGRIPKIRQVTATILPDGVTIGGDVALGPVAMKVAVRGNIKAEGSLIKFVAQDIAVNNFSAGGTLGALVNQITVYDLNRLPFPLQISDIKLEQGRIVVRAEKAQ